MPEIEELAKQPKYEIEKILRWCTKRVCNREKKEYYVLWHGYPLEEATWIAKDNSEDPAQLQRQLLQDQPTEE